MLRCPTPTRTQGNAAGPASSGPRPSSSSGARKGRSALSRRTMRWWLRGFSSNSEAQFLILTVLVSLGTYLVTMWLLDEPRGWEVGDADEFRHGLDDAEDATHSASPETAPLEWVGKKVEVLWPRHNEWYTATVTHYDAKRDMHLIQYEEDNAVERLSLNDPGNVRMHYGPEWIGRQIEVLYQDGRWYTATVVGQTSGGHVLYFPEDSSKEVVRLHSVKLRAPSKASSGDESRHEADSQSARRRQSDFAREAGLEGLQIEYRESENEDWRRAMITAYKAETQQHTLQYSGDAAGGDKDVALSDGDYRPYFGKDLVGRSIQIYWSEYNNWYEATVECFKPETNEHCVRYSDDGSDETLDLTSHQIVIEHGGELVGKTILLHDRFATSDAKDSVGWSTFKVMYFDAERSSHAIESVESGEVQKVVLHDTHSTGSRYIVRVLPANDADAAAQAARGT